ncbi:MAG: hypothetical protein ACR2QW_12695, partial [bacterium]
MKRDLFIVVGIKSNYRTLLKQAIEIGYKYNYNTRILDLNALVEGWRLYPNDWKELGIESSVTKIDSFAELRTFIKDQSVDARSFVLFLYPPTGKFRKAWKLLHAKFPNTGLITISPVPNSNRQHSDSTP